MSLLGRIIVIVFALIVSSIAVGMAIAVGLLGPQWHAFSGDVGERVTFWGVAFFGSVLTGAVGLLPLLILIGEKDDWTPAEACHRLQPDRPALVDAVYYPNAYHSFDAQARDRNVPGAPGKTHHLAYDPAAAPDAEARTQAFFDRLLKH